MGHISLPNLGYSNRRYLLAHREILQPQLLHVLIVCETSFIVKKQKCYLNIHKRFFYLECIGATGSQEFVRILNLSPDDMHIVPSDPPMQYKNPSRVATPQLLRRDDMHGTELHSPARGSNRSTDA